MFRTALTLFALTLLLTCPTSLRAQEGPIFPSRLDLQKKWDNFRSKEITPATIAAILKEDPDGGQLVRWGEGEGDERYTSIWAGVFRKLAADPKLSAQLRGEQDRDAQALVEQAAGDLGKLMVVARRFPWALCVHQALMEAGTQALHRGHAQLARGCFQDVLTCAADAGLRSQAQVGLWLAAAQDPGDDSLDAAFAGIDLKTLYPWMGKKASAGDIRARLKRKPPAVPFALKDLERIVLDVPVWRPWVFIQPAAHDEGLAVAGPRVLSWYDGTQTKPLWTKEHPLAPSEALWGGLVAAPFQPQVADGRLFTRWGIQTLPTKVAGRDYNLLVNVAALDLHTGKEIWSTSANADWEDLCPVNDPAVVDGRLYLLAVSRTKEFSPVYLVCLDAGQGTLLWKRELVTNHTTLMDVPRPPRPIKVDLAHFGLPVTVSHGHVYCLTNMGATACCDARDGLILWARSYAQDKEAGVLTRAGSAPLMAGSRVVFLPRDATVVFALDAATGEEAWFRRDNSAMQLLGTVDNTVILAGGRQISARKLDNGDFHWKKEMPEAVKAMPLSARSVLAGQAIYVGTHTKLFRLDAKTGEIAEEKDWDKLGPFEGMILRGKTLYLTSDIKTSRFIVSRETMNREVKTVPFLSAPCG